MQVAAAPPLYDDYDVNGGVNDEEHTRNDNKLLIAALAMLLLLPFGQLLGKKKALPPPPQVAAPSDSAGAKKKHEAEVRAALAECSEAAQQIAQSRAALVARLQDPDAELSSIFNAEALQNPQQPTGPPPQPADLKLMVQQADQQLQHYAAHMRELKRELGEN